MKLILRINGQEIVRTNSAQYLGIVINKLKWNNHANKI